MKTVLSTAACAACLCGCANTAPAWESTFSDASRNLRAAQVIDPDAPGRTTAARGVDGKAAAGAMKAYAESYGYAVKETKQPAVSISTTIGR
jgi:hypothetical protein